MKQNPGTAATRARAGSSDRPAPPHFIEIIPANAGIDFVRLAPVMIAISLAVILAGLAAVWLRGGLNYGIDFAGGTMVHVRLPQPVPVADVRSALDQPGLEGVVVQDVGGAGSEFQIRTLGSDEAAASAAAEAVKAGMRERFGEGSYDVLRVETVGPKVGKGLWRQAVLAVLAATVAMGIYIAFRFDFRFGIAAAVALVHDVLVAVGALSMANLEFDLTTVAALLTVVGFSVNDTVIISDRIRENMRKLRKESLRDIINLSVNETLSRTVITNSTAIVVVAALFWLGGSVIHSFAFTLLVGFIAGTYSSIYIASPIVLYMEGRGRRAA